MCQEQVSKKFAKMFLGVKNSAKVILLCHIDSASPSYSWKNEWDL
ncbi:hypothetical protein HMPREF9446_02864 [Bacteroides fluxus YIT 12057]|jgi:hypothetical protein|uniref:Uncharacterized protein n=1 Tax=Bacteroides fluxus YIT 12057 TaxID=763034 RepID=F3PVT6_9BACE|nr:hypothetical protein HMPREF9446_02864 [Bacteroides fluxus YIT 12057]